MFKSVSNKKDKKNIKESVFILLINEIIKTTLKELEGLKETEKTITSLGSEVGKRLFVFWIWERTERIENEIVFILQTIGNTVWKTMFNKKIDSIEINSEKEYMLVENEAILSKFFAPTKEFLYFNPSCYFAGIIEGILSCSLSERFAVSAHSAPIQGHSQRTIFLIKRRTN